jgi:hypothetical protein
MYEYVYASAHLFWRNLPQAEDEDEGEKVGQQICDRRGVVGSLDQVCRREVLLCREVVVQQESDADLYIYSPLSVLPGVNSYRNVAPDRKHGVDGIEM